MSGNDSLLAEFTFTFTKAIFSLSLLVSNRRRMRCGRDKGKWADGRET